MYAHRLLRLLPVLFLAVLAYGSLYHYLGNGPVWANFDHFYQSCGKNWWATLLFIQNYTNPSRMVSCHLKILFKVTKNPFKKVHRTYLVLGGRYAALYSFTIISNSLMEMENERGSLCCVCRAFIYCMSNEY